MLRPESFLWREEPLSSALGGERRGGSSKELKMETESDGANRKRRVDLCAVCQAEMHSLDWIGRRQKMNRFLPIRPFALG